MCVADILSEFLLHQYQINGNFCRYLNILYVWILFFYSKSLWTFCRRRHDHKTSQQRRLVFIVHDQRYDFSRPLNALRDKLLSRRADGKLFQTAANLDYLADLFAIKLEITSRSAALTCSDLCCNVGLKFVNWSRQTVFIPSFHTNYHQSTLHDLQMSLLR